MSFRWSFSTDKLFRRCQRQFYFAQIAAHHSPREPWRREAFLLRQMKTLELWRGSVIHEGIQHYVVPALRKGDPLEWEILTEQTIQRAKAQLAFSERKRYREAGIAKGEHEDFCALIPHETGKGVSTQEYQRTPKQRIESATAIVNTFLAGMSLTGVGLKISPVPRSAPGKHFDYPEIRFGHGHTEHR